MLNPVTGHKCKQTIKRRDIILSLEIRNKRIVGNKKVIGLIFALGLLLLLPLTIVDAATTPTLGAAEGFAVLAGSTVTNTGVSTIIGDLGVSPGTAITGFPPGTVSGSIHSADTLTSNAQADLTTAYNNAAGQASTATVSTDLGGQTLAPGVYNSASTLGITGTLTLDGQGDTNSVFIFQAGSALTTASNSQVVLINGAQARNVFWQVGSSATIGTNSAFVGTILAYASITVNTGATVNGRVLACTGAVTLDSNNIGFSPSPFVAPESALGALTAIGVCFAALGVMKIKRSRR
jgi:hypothetical protein